MLLLATLLASHMQLAMVQSVICQPPQAVTITNPANNSTVTAAGNTVQVTGTSEASQSVNILDNSQVAAQVTSDSAGNFVVTIPLSSGLNQLQAQVSNACGTINSGTVSVTYNQIISVTPSASPAASQSPTSSAVNVTPSATPNSTSSATVATPSASPNTTLSLSIEGPTDNSTTTGVSVSVFGTAESESQITIYVNGQLSATLTSGNDGKFQANVPLSLGSNTIKIVETKDGQTATDQVVVNRAAPNTNTIPQIVWYIVGAVGAFCLVFAILRRRRGHS